MPEGLESGLSLAEFSDLISYVENPVVPDAPKPPALAGHSRGNHPPNSGPAGQADAPSPLPEPGADLFSFLDVPPLPDEPVNSSTPAVLQPPPAIRPPRGTASPRAPPTPPPPAMSSVTDDSNPPARPLPPMPPGWKPPMPAPPP